MARSDFSDINSVGAAPLSYGGLGARPTAEPVVHNVGGFLCPTPSDIRATSESRGRIDMPLVAMVRAELAGKVCARAPAVSLRAVQRQSQQRQRDISWPVHVAAYIAHVELGLTQLHSARLVGRTEPVIRTAAARVEDARDDPAFDDLVDRLTDQAREMIL